jgi:serine/threonine-protein kinase
VPALVELEQGEALNSISGFDWKVDIVAEASESVPAGHVVRTIPAQGVSLAEGKSLQLVVSTGPAPRVLPEVKGLTVDAAAAQLQGMALLVKVGDEPFDENVPAGTIISWMTPAQPGLVAGDTVVAGTQVVVVVSAGPAPRAVANVVGMALADATAALGQQQLTVAQLPDEFSDTVPAGQIARQDPPAGTEVPRGATVSIAVSKGQDLVAVPDLGALDPAGVRAALTAAGLRVGTVVGDATQPLAGASIGGGPPLAAGQMVKRDSAVDLTYPPPPPAA